jgi:hypothetical protein
LKSRKRRLLFGRAELGAVHLSEGGNDSEHGPAAYCHQYQGQSSHDLPTRKGN